MRPDVAPVVRPFTRTTSLVASTSSSTVYGTSIMKILAESNSRWMWSVRRNTATPAPVG